MFAFVDRNNVSMALPSMSRELHMDPAQAGSAVGIFFWGYLLYMGSLNTLWRMLGIANQLLASIALAVGTTYLLNHAPKRKYALCTSDDSCDAPPRPKPKERNMP